MQPKTHGFAWLLALAVLLCTVGVSTTQAQTSQNMPYSAIPPTMGAPPALHDKSFGTPNRRVAATNPQATSTAERLSDYILGPGDRVHIIVYGKADLTATYQIDGAGKLRFPLIGPVQAAGLTGGELEQLIVSKLKPQYFKDPNVVVEVAGYRPFYILGEVRVPGGYPYVSGMSVVIGVALAGGFTYRARESSFDVTRTKSDGTKAHIEATQDTPVEPGDIITVKERYF